MKNLILATTITCAALAGPVQAGSMSDPAIEAPVIIQDTAASSSSGAALVALLSVVMMIPVLD